jgi:hypothetical protein
LTEKIVIEEYQILWRGPYEWPELRVKSRLDTMEGIYMWTVESKGGYVASGCGITRRSIRERVMEHRRAYLQGMYTLLDIDSMRLGIRKEIWHGMWAGYNTEESKAEFLRRKSELQNVAREQMAATRIFVAEESDQRIQERVESAIMQTLYAAPEPYCDLPDRGTLEMPRRDNEERLLFINRSEPHFINLAETMKS